MTIYGNLTIDEDVENGDVYLDDLDIRGHVYIYGGGDDTVSFEDCQIEGNIYAKKDHGSSPVGLKIDSNTAEDLDGYISIEDNGAILKAGGKLDRVYVQTGSEVQINTDVKNLYVNANTSDLTITAGTTVNKLSISSSSAKGSTITNKGTINELNTSQNITVNGDGTINNPTGDGTVTPDDGQKISVTGVSLNKTATTIEVGKTEKLTATVTPDNATNKNVTWKSSNEDVATVGKDGTVTARAVGTADITVTTADGSKTATCAVTVNPKTVPVAEVKLDETELELEEGATATLTATVLPEDATDKTVTWTIGGTNSDAVTLNDTTGKEVTVTAATAGTATITAKAGEKTATCTVTVTARTVAVTGVTIKVNGSESETATMTAGGELQLMAEVLPENATNKTVTWESSNSEYVSVTPSETENGKATITAIKPTGESSVTITAKAIGGENITDSIEITVNPKALESITLTTDKNTLTSVNDTTTITATANPEGAELGTVTWRSSNDEVATVQSNEDGTATVTAKASGTATITATAGEKSEECQITVNVPVTDVTIKAPEGTQGGTSENPATMTAGRTLQLTANVRPDGADYDQITWESSDPSVATVENGLVTAQQVTETTSVTITAKVDNTHSATFTIIVQAAETTNPGEGGTETGVESQTSGETTTTTQATSNAIVVSR